MKNSRYAKIARILFLIAMVSFLLAIAMQCLNFNAYVNIVLYSLAIISFTVGTILAYIAARKDEEHMKNVELIKKDERFNNITVLSKAKAFDTFSMIFALTILLCVSFLKVMNIYILMVVMGIMPLLLLALQMYYFYKFSKKM